MATVQTSDFREFCDFVVRLRDNGVSNVTPEQSLQEFRTEQEKLRVWNERNAIAAEQTRRGDYRPLDLDALLKRVELQLAEKGGAD